MNEKAYTTFQISKFCHVNHRTVLSWIKQNKIKAFKTPGGHSRVREKDLVRFLKEYDIPLPDSIQSKVPVVLVVDDEPRITEIISQALSSDKEFTAGLHVETSTNGIDALMKLGKNPPDIIILDVCMPNLDGIEVCKRIRENPDTSDIEIIAMSGVNIEQTAKDIMAAGADDFIGKPFEIEDLLKKVLNTLKSHE